jgi:hypothetical protein
MGHIGMGHIGMVGIFGMRRMGPAGRIAITGHI